MLAALCVYDPEVESFLFRCRTEDNADCTEAVKIELRTFNKWVYAAGLRDGSGRNHILRECSLAHSTSFHRQKLWWIAGNANSMRDRGTASPFFFRNTTRYGWEIEANGGFDMGARCSQFDSANCSMTIWHGWHSENGREDCTGNENSASDRYGFYCARTNIDQYNFDVGNASNRVTGTMVANNYRGLNVANKFASEGWIYQNGIRRGATTGLNSPILPALNIMVNNTSPGVNASSIAGFVFGTSIPENLQSDYYQRWYNLMISVDERRKQELLDIPNELGNGLTLWLDAKDNSLITRDNNVITGWRDRSGNANNITFSNGSPIYVDQTSMDTNGAVSTSNGINYGTIAVVFTPRTRYDSGTAGSEYLFGIEDDLNSNWTFSGIAIGNITSALENEIVTYLRSNNQRDGYLSTSRNEQDIIAANRRICLIMSNQISGSTKTSRINFNGINRTVSFSTTAGGVSVSLLNRRWALGHVVVNRRTDLDFNGVFHEIMSYNRYISDQEVITLYNYLSNKWNLN